MGNAHNPPFVLCIGGHDCSSGAGIMTDAQAVLALGAYPLTVSDAVVAECPGEVVAVNFLPTTILRAQLDILLRKYPISAVKLGMIGSLANARVLREILERLRNENIPIVIDPVGSASTGALLNKKSVPLYAQKHIYKLATILTPNYPEALQLLKCKGQTLSEINAVQNCQNGEANMLEGLAKKITQLYQCTTLLKGAHLKSMRKIVIDVLALREGKGKLLQTVVFKDARLKVEDIHGTGCALASLVATKLAFARDKAFVRNKGLDIRDEKTLISLVREARFALRKSIAKAHRWPKAPPALKIL